MTPHTLFPALARAEVVTWALLLFGMFLKYVTRTTEIGVAVFGLVHGVVFLAYLLVTALVRVDQRWGVRFALFAVAGGVVPFGTLWVERVASRRGLVGAAWRLGPGGQAPVGPAEQLVTRALARPALAAGLGTVGVLATTGVLLALGPPGS